MAQSRGKKFEDKFQKNWEETVANSKCYRLYDTMGGRKGVKNAGDFICYKKGTNVCFIIDCKSTNENTFSVNFRQYDEMLKYYKVFQCGVVIWFCKRDHVVWVPFETFTKLREEGKKSFNIKMLGDENYFSIDIPSTKLRTFMNSDYSSLVDYYSKGA